MHILKNTVFGINLLNLTFLILQMKECSAQSGEKCSGKICIPSDYDRLSLPNPNEVNNINIEIFRLKFLKVNDNTCIIKTSFWFVMNWNDKSGFFNGNDCKIAKQSSRTVHISWKNVRSSFFIS